LKNVPAELSKKGNSNSTFDHNFIKVLIALFLPYFALSLAQNGFLGLLPFVREEFNLTRVQIGYYSTFFFFSASLLSVFTGSIVDKLGSKKGMLSGIGSLGILMILHGLTPSYSLLLFLSFLTGLGFSIITPSATKAVVMVTPPEKRAFSMGITQSGFGLGGILGASLLPFLGESLSWRAAVQMAAMVILITGPLVYKLYQEQNNNSDTINLSSTLLPDEREAQQSIWQNLLSILKDKPLFKVCLLGILFGITEGALLSHFVVFLAEDLRISRVGAGLCFAVLHWGGIAGLIGWGWLSDRFFKAKRRFSLFLIGVTSGIMYLSFGLFLNHPFSNQTIVFFSSFLFGFLTLGWSGVYFTSVGEIAGNVHAGIATGLSLFFVRSLMIIAPPLFGLIADWQECYRYSWLLFSLVIFAISSFFLQKD